MPWYKTLDIATAFEISNYQGKTPSEEGNY
jgi:hypothetical protein